jgi:UDP-2,3-diacylglucosamine pyrophosphatase LpxH
MKYKSIFISDLHLGTEYCQADRLHEFLSKNSSEKLYLNGDILDLWKIHKNNWVWYQSHSNVCEKILEISKNTLVIYVIGNHDETFRKLSVFGFNLGNIIVTNETDHYGIDGKRYLVTHGDLYDGIGDFAPYLVHFGDYMYDVALHCNLILNKVRKKFGYGYWSISKYLKSKVKSAVGFIFKFEVHLAEHCKNKGFDGVICGHIHHAEIKEINGVVYMNSGDWVESCTALVENFNGTWEIIHYG